jgi:hypothetical protein
LAEALRVRRIGPHSSFRSSLPYQRQPKPRLGGAPRVAGQLLPETSCSARFQCAEWSCVVFSDSPRPTADWAEIGRISRSLVQSSDGVLLRSKGTKESAGESKEPVEAIQRLSRAFPLENRGLLPKGENLDSDVAATAQRCKGSREDGEDNSAANHLL